MGGRRRIHRWVLVLACWCLMLGAAAPGQAEDDISRVLNEQAPPPDYDDVMWNDGIPGFRVYEYDPWMEPDGMFDSGAGFGAAVATDGEVAVIGSPGSDLNGSNHGAAFVYERSEDAWVRTQILLPSNVAEKPDSVRFRSFGNDVALAGDRIFVAARGHDTGCNRDVGAVYVFEKQGGDWVQSERLWRNGTDADAFCDTAPFDGVPTDGMSGDDEFGVQIAASGDTLVVSSYNRDWSGFWNCRPNQPVPFEWWEEGGAYHIFQHGQTGWKKKGKIEPDGEQIQRVAAFEDGVLAVVTGGWEVETRISPDDCVDNDAPPHTVRIYENDGSGWTQQQAISLGPGGDCCIARDLQISADQMLVSTELGNDERVRALQLVGGTWSLTGELEPPDQLNTQFGQTVALDGSRALVGAPWFDALSGAVFGYELVAGEWVLRGRLSVVSEEFWLPSGYPQLQLFGTDVALAGLTGLVGAEGDVVYAEELEITPGSAYFFELPSGNWPPPPDSDDGRAADDGGSFVDVPESHTFYADIEWLAAEGITKGCNPPANDEFCPDSFVTRGQMAAFLVRALGYTDDGGGDLFVDDNGNTFEADIDKLGTAGVTRGCNPPVNDRYCPDGFVTRGQMAAFLVRALGYTDDGGGDLFVDDNGNTFEADIDKLGTAGVTRGCNPPVNDRYCPDQFVTRGHMAAFLHRALGS